MENLKEYSSLPDYVEYCGWACVCVCVCMKGTAKEGEADKKRCCL